MLIHALKNPCDTIFYYFIFIYYTLSLEYIENQNKHQNTVNLLNIKIHCTHYP